jgi:hypothetical protein
MNYLCNMSKSSHIFLVVILGQILLAGACAESVPGCTDPSSPNYDPLANDDDGSCLYATPDDYRFVRDEESSVDLDFGLSRQLRIDRFEAMLIALGENGALYQDPSPIVFGYPDSLSFLSLVTDVDTVVPSVLGSLARGDSLVATFFPTAGISDPRGLFSEALDYIDQQAMGTALGTPAVYTSPEGLDYARFLPPILAGYSLLAPAVDSLLTSFDTLDNIALSGNSTAAERAWDHAFSLFGHPIVSANWYNGSRAWNDLDQNDTLNFDEEYVFFFAREGYLRDAAVAEANFSGRMFLAFRQGRAAIAFGPERIGEASVAALELRDYWEQIMAATAIHHLNEARQLLSSNPIDSVAYSAAWSAAAGYIQALGVKQDSRINPVSISATLGSFPSTGATYSDSLANARMAIGDSYGFSEDWQERW